MNVTELARKLRVHPKKMLEILPQHGFDIGGKAIKVDDKVAQTIIRRWKYIKKEIQEAERKEEDLKKEKEKELRREEGVSVDLPELITVREFAERLKLPVTAVITELMKNGILANQNQHLDHETATIMAEDLGFSVVKEDVDSKTGIGSGKEEERFVALEDALNKGNNKQKRAPVIVVMGHVDHGKTRLLDTIREANIIETESGGITQHIGAYQTVWKDPSTSKERALTFIDTPGHEAFTVMRSRGAKVADMAILVVAADDGVKPQTEEVIQIIHAAKMPFVVAINKIDKETADVTRVKTELAQKGIQPEDWSGDVPMVEISAKEKINIDKLLDLLLLVSDINEETMQADPTIPAVGTVIESHMDKHVGPVATLLVQAGTLKKGDPLVVNNEIYGKVRAMKDYNGVDLIEAGPSVPVRIIGFKVAPEVGDVLNVGDADTAEKIDVKAKRSQMTGAARHTIMTAKKDDEDEKGAGKKSLNLVIKADVLGSLEAIIGSLEKIVHDEVAVKIIGKGLGNITESDVAKVEGKTGVLVGFHVNPTTTADESIREKDIHFLRFDIIYDLIKWVQDELEKLLDAEKIITELGNLKVLAIFRTDKGAMTVGGRVESGKVLKDSKVRIKRDGEEVGRGVISKLQIGKQNEKKVTEGTECGLRYEGKTKITEGDVLEFYTEESKIRKIEFVEA
jgi:translation initiation factor IF-2